MNTITTNQVPAINVPTNGSVITAGVVQNDSAAIAANTQKVNALEAMEAARISWENNELVASNKRLYSILKDAYAFYWDLKKNSSSVVRDAHKSQLDAFIKQKGYGFLSTSHDMTRVVKCVFGVDRRRVSAYSIALREALRQEVAVDDLVEFIEAEGGVEQIRMGGTKPLSMKKRAELVKDEVLSKDLTVLKFDADVVRPDADWADKQVVIVATYLPTGEFHVNAVVQHDTAVNAALAAYRSQQAASERAQAKAEREAEKEAQKAEKEAAAKKADEEREIKKAEKVKRSNAAFDKAEKKREQAAKAAEAFERMYQPA